MKDDYLWDPSGPPDAEVQRLERLLGRLRSAPQVPALPDMVRDTVRLTPGPTYSIRFLVPALAAAAAIVMMVGLMWQANRNAPSWEVASIHGQPRIGSTPLSGAGRLSVGQTLSTDQSSRARMEVGSIGQVTVDTDTRVRLVETRDTRHQLALERGTLHAFIVAPPGQFIVDTPSATAIDLGCVYDLFVDEDGSGLLTVVAGWVAFEDNGRESFVPAGASARTDRSNGPGTPRYNDAEPAFREALDEIDYSRTGATKGNPLRVVLERARPRDAMTLWTRSPASHLPIARPSSTPSPRSCRCPRQSRATLDRCGWTRRHPDQWWYALGLRDTGWWRKSGRRPCRKITRKSPDSRIHERMRVLARSGWQRHSLDLTSRVYWSSKVTTSSSFTAARHPRRITSSAIARGSASMPRRCARAAPYVVVDLILSSGTQARELHRSVRGATNRVVALSSCDVYRACGVLHGVGGGSARSGPAHGVVGAANEAADLSAGADQDAAAGVRLARRRVPTRFRSSARFSATGAARDVRGCRWWYGPGDRCGDSCRS